MFFPVFFFTVKRCFEFFLIFLFNFIQKICGREGDEPNKLIKEMKEDIQLHKIRKLKIVGNKLGCKEITFKLTI